MHVNHGIREKKEAPYTEELKISITYRYEVEKYNVGLWYTLL
jgi:hypothetical protein